MPNKGILKLEERPDPPPVNTSNYLKQVVVNLTYIICNLAYCHTSTISMTKICSYALSIPIYQ